MKDKSHQSTEKGLILSNHRILKPPRHGYIKEIAAICNCNRRTVTRALFEGYTGPKSDEVIRVFNKMYKE